MIHALSFGICKYIKKLLISVFIFLSANLQAQLHLNTTLQNMILWRGIEVADGLIYRPICRYPIPQEGLLQVSLAGQTPRVVIRN